MNLRTAGVLVLGLALCGLSSAAEIDYSHITITDSSPGFNAQFGVENIPTNAGLLPDTNSLGYASMGAGLDTFVQFAFDVPHTLSSITYIDRIHSGAAADTIGGTADYVTEYDLILSENATFGDADDTVVSVGPLTPPDTPTSIDDFTTATTIDNVTAQYVMWDVVANTGVAPNNGAHTFLFDGVAVPEPSTALLTLLALLGLVGHRRRYRRV